MPKGVEGLHVPAGLVVVGRKLDVARAAHRDSDPHGRRARYACMCSVRVLHGSWDPCLVLWEDADALEVVSRRVAERAASSTLGLVIVAPNPWRALTEEDIADIWRLAPPGSIIRPIHAGLSATLLVECPDGSFSKIAVSSFVDDIPGAMRLAYGDAAPEGTWVLKRPVRIDRGSLVE
jgi:hypothetical protein